VSALALARDKRRQVERALRDLRKHVDQQIGALLQDLMTAQQMEADAEAELLALYQQAGKP
jgi:hypothetical protein